MENLRNTATRDERNLKEYYETKEIRNYV